MNFSRGKVQILYNYLPGAVFPHDEYGHCRVTTIEVTELAGVNRAALADVANDVLQQWTNDWQREGFPPINNEAELARNYLIGEPTSVLFEPFPTTLRCQRCGRVQRLTDLRRARGQPGRCPVDGCGAPLEQMPFLQAHHCGRLDEMFVQREGCTRHGTAGLYFDDTGRVTTARWRCRLCGNAEVARLRQTPCACQFSRFGTQDPSEQRLRLLVTTDPAVFKPQIAPFINFPQEQMVGLATPEARPWVLARVWGLLNSPVRTAMTSVASTASDAEMDAAVRDLAEVAPNHPRVLAWQKSQAERATRSDPVANVLALLPGETTSNIRVSRRMLEQVAVLDSVAGVSVEDVAQRIERSGDTAQATRLRGTQQWAADRLGIASLRALDGFPIGLAAMGFTRIKSDPSQTILNPFPQIDQRTPIYSVVASTEAIYCQLDPRRIVAWLEHNRLLTAADDVTTPADAWARLYRDVPGLGVRRSDPAYVQPAASAVRTLVHTMSHVLLRHIEWSGYGAQSIGEYLIPDGLAFVLYASRYTDTKVGGLLTLFEQGLDRWLQSAHHEGGDCVMDPFCAEEGGACVGCLHREFNCTEFNRELSRAVLFGGHVPQEGAAVVPFGPTVTGFWRT
jgi:hypothetical protein